MNPTGFLFYLACVAIFSTYMVYRVVPKYGPKDPMVYLSICSLVGSVSVMAIKVGRCGRQMQKTKGTYIVVGPGTGLWNRIEVDDRGEQPVDTRFDLLVRVDCIGLHLGANGRAPLGIWKAGNDSR